MAKKKSRQKQSSVPVTVRKMSLGRGVYTVRELPASTVVGVVEGKVYDDPEFSSNYCVDMGENLSLEPRRPFRFLNHSCDPNCALMLLDDPDSIYGRVVIVETLRDIAKGEELTIDYAWPIDSAIPCLCQSPRCRGWIVDRKQLPALKRKLASAAGTTRKRKSAAQNGVAKE